MEALVFQPKLAVLDYGMGNLRSVDRALEHVGAKVFRAQSLQELNAADALVLPGVGALGDCMDALAHHKLDGAIRSWIAEDRPFLGICLGFQALFDHSEEGNVRGLGIFPGRVRHFQASADHKVPHMGWNTLSFKQRALASGIPEEGAFVYFVHSYYVVPEDTSLVWTETCYGRPFVSAIRQGNCFATQFHPEKSQALGLRLLHNFCSHVVLGTKPRMKQSA